MSQRHRSRVRGLMFQRRERSTWLKCLTDLSCHKPGAAERGGLLEENELGVIGLTAKCALPPQDWERLSNFRGHIRGYDPEVICASEIMS